MTLPPDPDVAPEARLRTLLRRRGIAIAVAIGAVIAVIVTVPFWRALVAPERHVDGDGPLASLDGDGAIGMSVPGASGRPITFGLRLCVADGSDRVVVESIGPTVAVGSGVTYLGGRVRSLDFTNPAEDHTTIGSVEGSPPPSIAPATIVDAIGTAVTRRCERENPTGYTELLLGFQGGGAGVSGGWHGVDVGYQAGWRHRVVSIRYDLLVCGSASDCADELIP
jgi:hypothetical protein